MIPYTQCAWLRFFMRRQPGMISPWAAARAWRLDVHLNQQCFGSPWLGLQFLIPMTVVLWFGRETLGPFVPTQLKLCARTQATNCHSFLRIPAAGSLLMVNWQGVWDP